MPFEVEVVFEQLFKAMFDGCHSGAPRFKIISTSMGMFEFEWWFFVLGIRSNLLIDTSLIFHLLHKEKHPSGTSIKPIHIIHPASYLLSPLQNDPKADTRRRDQPPLPFQCTSSLHRDTLTLTPPSFS